uniref:Exostosin GT47 domain-containing protein n=1 Tax=Leersia perrieri TaxID=77586 RepID=A0A0D9UVV5_9ORYZ
MPPHPAPLPCKLLTRRRAVAAAAVLAAAALLLAATQDPTAHPYLVGETTSKDLVVDDSSASGRFEDDASSSSSFSPSEPPLPSLLETNFPSTITTAPSMLLAPSPSPAENSDDGLMEETEPPDLKPISSGSPIRRPDINVGHDSNARAMLPPRLQVDALRSYTADGELIYAKKEISNAPLVSGDPDLHAPLFRNVSVFRRTKGADHFFVACHDWGPYTTKLHEELRKNTIKALCNADLSEGVFVHGRDVSLPETFIRSPKRPLRGIGGKPAAERSILAFFAGQMHGRVRPVLLQYWGGKDADMKIYDSLPHRITRRMNYVQHMKSSKYCICPMGYEVNSPRIVEAIYYECVPVIIADNFVLPFDDALNWSAFSVVIPEKDVPKLKQILLEIPEDQYVAMQLNVKRVQKHFLWHQNPIKYDIFHMILHSIWFSRVNQIPIE